MMPLRRFFDAQIDEIRQDPALRIYGAFVAFGQVLCFLNWLEREAAWNLSKTGGAICWPFFEDCFRYRVLEVAHVKVVLGLFAAAALVGVALFCVPGRVRAAYWWLAGVNIFKTLVYVQDYRLRMNQHYMLYWATLVFLLLPNKRRVLRYMLVGFYVWASTLKYNAEWLSGQALYANPMGISDQWIPAACAYAVVLEAVIVWGVLSARPWVYWSALFQLCLFHLVSWPVVGFFYPMLMFSLLAIFPLTRLLRAPQPQPSSLLSTLVRGREPRVTYLYLACFSLLQLVPVAMPGDEKVTGEGRLFSLHMFDAQVYCEGAITLKFSDGTTQRLLIPMEEKTRIRCDPVVNFSWAKRLCYEHRDDPAFQDLDLVYQARRAHEPAMKPLVDSTNFCSRGLSYDMLRPNDWILKR